MARSDGSILLSTHYDPLSGRPAARRVLERFFSKCSAAPEGGLVAIRYQRLLASISGSEKKTADEH